MSLMYADRAENIPFTIGCNFGCTYCAFPYPLRRSSCEGCSQFKFHVHPKALSRKPPKTKSDRFVTIGLSSDISFLEEAQFEQILAYCRTWSETTFMIQSKNPSYFLQFEDSIPPNVIICTTIETNREQIWEPSTAPRFIDAMHYSEVSKAPVPKERYEAMRRLDSRCAVTVEPALDCDIAVMEKWIADINPEFVHVGMDSRLYKGADNRKKLPEPSLQKMRELIRALQAHTRVKIKLLRTAWWELPIEQQKQIRELRWWVEESGSELINHPHLKTE